MEKYFILVLLAVCIGSHIWMMRKMKHTDHNHEDKDNVGHCEHGDSGTCHHDEDRKIS